MGSDRTVASDGRSQRASTDDRKVLSGIFWRYPTGVPWADIPERFGPYTTCYNRFVRWCKRGIWERIYRAVSELYDGDLQVIGSSSIRVHQHAASIPLMPNRKRRPAFSAFLYRYRNLAERFFNKLKHFRAVATRYDKGPGQLSRISPARRNPHLDPPKRVYDLERFALGMIGA